MLSQLKLIFIYGENVMSDGMVRKLVRQFNDGRTNVRDEERSGRPSAVNDGVVENEKIRESKRFAIKMLCNNFSQISETVH
ncbi:HTH_48 domain-containing protein [Trichonephila clavipes]|nr:HTH_48 domain-containing protein [Trichonephila clavipes]